MAKKPKGTKTDEIVHRNTVWRIFANKTPDQMNEIFIAAKREVMQEYANGIAEGYNKIVADWENTPVRFVGKVEFQKRTGRFYARVQVVGQRLYQRRFRSIDRGEKRAKKVGLKHITYPWKMQVPYQVMRAGAPITIPDARKKSGTRSVWIGSENPKERKAWIKAAEVKMSPYEQAMERALSGAFRFTQQSYQPQTMPMRQYIPRTMPMKYGGPGIRGKGVYHPGKGMPPGQRSSGGDWSLIKYKRQVTMGDIEARGFTEGLSDLVLGGSGIGGAAAIWPQNVRKRNMIRRARYRTRHAFRKS